MASVSVLDFVAPYHYVYFIRALNTGLVKIGRTKNLGHRFAQLTSLVGPLKIIGCIPTFDPYLENQIHRLLKSHQVRLGDKAVGLTEWFQLSDEVAVIVIKEILRGIRSWSEEPTARVRNETSPAIPYAFFG